MTYAQMGPSFKDLSDTTGTKYEHDVIPVSRWEGTRAAAAASLFTGLGANILTGAAYAYNKLEDLPEEPLIKSRHDVLANLSDEISRMRPGKLSWLDKNVVGSAMAIFADPYQDIFGLGASKAIGSSSSPLFGAIGDLMAQKEAIPKAVGLALEGGVMGTPQALSALAISKPLHDDYNTVDALSTIGTWMVGGPALHLGFGVPIKAVVDRFGLPDKTMTPAETYNPVTSGSMKEGVDVAAGQLELGKSVDVQPIIDKGLTEKRVLDPVNLDDVDTNIKSLKNNIDDLNNQIEQSHNDITTSLGSANLRKVVYSPIDAANRLNQIEAKAPEDHTSYEQSVRMMLPDTPEITKAAKILKKPAELRADADHELLDKLDTPQGETEVIKQRLYRDEKKVTKLRDKYQDASDVDKEKIKQRLSKIKLDRDIARDRLEKISKLKKYKTHQVEGDQQYHDELLRARASLQDSLEQHRMASEIQRTAPPNTTSAQELKAFGEHQASTESNFHYNENIPSTADLEKGLPENDTAIPAGLEEHIDKLQKENKLFVDDAEKINEANEDMKQEPLYKKLYNSIAQCLGMNI